MRFLRILASLVIINTVVFSATLFSHSTKSYEAARMSMGEVLKLLNSSDWQERDLALEYGIDSFIENDTVKIALINLLEREIQISEEWWKKYHKIGGDAEHISKKYKEEYGFGEGYGEYEIELIDKVIELKDKRAINPLVAVAYMGNKPTNAVAKFGRLAIEPLVCWFYKTKNEDSKVGVVYVLGKIVETCKFDSIIAEGSPLNIIPFSKKRKIIDFFINALQDSNPYIREGAIRPLSSLMSNNAIPLLKKIVEEDTYNIIEGKKGKIYPVRKEAEKVLKELEEKKKE